MYPTCTKLEFLAPSVTSIVSDIHIYLFYCPHLPCLIFLPSTLQIITLVHLYHFTQFFINLRVSVCMLFDGICINCMLIPPKNKYYILGLMYVGNNHVKLLSTLFFLCAIFSSISFFSLISLVLISPFHFKSPFYLPLSSLSFFSSSSPTPFSPCMTSPS